MPEGKSSNDFSSVRLGARAVAFHGAGELKKGGLRKVMNFQCMLLSQGIFFAKLSLSTVKTCSKSKTVNLNT